MSASHLQSRPFASDVYMVPDDEVHQCPICTKKFQPVLVPKHHCRNCGKVICGACSSNQITLAGTKGKQRVCDNCYQLLNHAKGESLTEDYINHETQKKSLTSDIQEKRKQKDWFTSFMYQIGADASGSGDLAISPQLSESGSGPGSFEDDPGTVDEEASLEDSGTSAPRSREEELLANVRALQPDLRNLVIRARGRWKEHCSDLAEARRGNNHIGQNIIKLDKDYDVVAREIEKIQREIKNMVEEKGETHTMEAIRDKLRETTTQQQEELDGLERRMRKLQDDVNVASFSQGPSSVGGHGDSCHQRCVDRFTRPEGCSLM